MFLLKTEKKIGLDDPMSNCCWPVVSRTLKSANEEPLIKKLSDRPVLLFDATRKPRSRICRIDMLPLILDTTKKPSICCFCLTKTEVESRNPTDWIRDQAPRSRTLEGKKDV
ncbi:hypothetical protein L1987_44389 [Smallanthus sonchifolius]|uniref:Uncharacterized protein n=1 Tax=Smallanthus sonchifolius TaxID=185202 RepID=A0ACB9GP31_9ASTR|nr:hypothetical protein L1987_44389 [Smallanthus sonchifolius]